jgi:type II secretory pathway pseudopilin PulG
MSDDEDQPYRLPTPDLGVFGSEDGKTEPGEAPADRAEATEGPRHGTMRFQDESTKPREPTLAERRARQQAEEAEREAASQAQADAEAEAERRRHRKRVMIGAGVTVGIVAVVGGLYLASRSDDVTARCTSNDPANNGTVVQDQYCDEDYVTSHGGHIANGIIFLPIPGGGYNQYHYYYGGSGNIGQRVSGGSYTQPSSGTIKTNSGSTVSRGGLGVSSKSGGGSSGGSGGDEGGSHSGGGKSGGS